MAKVLFYRPGSCPHIPRPAMQIVINILLVIHVLVSLLIVFLVLMQRPKNEGLGAAFGGGVTDNLFGAQTTNVLQTITRWLGCIFFALSLGLSLLYVKAPRKSGLVERLGTGAAAPAKPVPADKDAATSDAGIQKQVDDAIKKALEQKKDGAPAPDAPAPEAPAPTAPAPTAPAPAVEKPSTPEAPPAK